MTRRAVVFEGPDVNRTIGRPGLLERTGAAAVVREPATRLDVLLQRIAKPDAEALDDLPESLQGWFASMLATEATAPDVGLVVMSLRHELLGPTTWRHVPTGLLLEPPADYQASWSDQERRWLHGACEPAEPRDDAAPLEALRRVADLLHTDERMLLVLTVSTFDPEDTAFVYSGVADTFALRAHRLIAEAQALGVDRGVGLVDVDRAIAELGAAQHVPAAGQFSEAAAEFITEEAIYSFDQAALFGTSMQPDVMRLVLPAYDRRTERGRLTKWHVGPQTRLARGDDVFDVYFANLPLRVDHDEADRDKKRPTKGRRQTRDRSLEMTVVAASEGFLCDVVVAEGAEVAVGDPVALVAPRPTDRSLTLDEAEGDFRVAVRSLPQRRDNRDERAGDRAS